MKKKTLLTLLLMAGMNSFAQKSGIIFGVTDGHLGQYSGYSYYMETANTPYNLESKWSPRIGFNLGYQFTFPLSHTFWFDTSVLGKATQGEIRSFFLEQKKAFPFSDKEWIWGLALNGTINCRIASGLYAGLGIEPTSYFKTDNLNGNDYKQVLDFPAVLTLGYGFRNGMKLSACYKHGFKSLYSNTYLNNTRNNQELGITVFLPMGK